jgi:CBS domain-containing protein
MGRVNRTGPSPQIGNVRVSDCMHQGIVSCSEDTPLSKVADTMAEHHIHAVAVTNGGAGRPLAVVSDLDVVGAIATGEEPTAGQVAGTEPLTVSSEDSLGHASQLMTEHGVAHLVVVDSASGYPIGILSTLDVAAAYAR